MEAYYRMLLHLQKGGAEFQATRCQALKLS